MPPDKIHVVHVVVSLEKGGAEKQLYLLCTQPSPACVHSVIAVCREGYWADRLREQGVPVYCLHASRPASWHALTSLVRSLKRLRPEVVQCWLPSMNLLGTMAVWLARLSQTAVAASVRNVDNWKPLLRLWAERVAQSGWDAVITNSWASLRQMEADGVGAGKTVVIPNGIEPLSSTWNRDSARQALGLGPADFVVAWASRLVAQKRPELMMQVARENPEMRFVVAGGGPLWEQLCSQLPDNVQMLGPVESTAQLLIAADVYFSTSSREGTSNSLLEALQAGCPAVVTDAGDSLRVAGEAGVAVTPETAAGVLHQLRQSPSRLAALRAAARRRAEAYPVSAMVSSYERVYQRLSGRDASRRVLYLDYTNGIGVGGGQRSLLLMLGAVDRARFQPVLACPEGEQWLTLAPNDVEVHALRLPEAFRGLNRNQAGWGSSLAATAHLVSSVRSLGRLIRHQRIDLIHANNLKMLLLGALAGWPRKMPVIWHVRDIFPNRRFARAALWIGARLAARVVAVSGAVAKQFDATAQVIYNAVRLPGLESAPVLRRAFRAGHGIPDSGFLFGYVGRLDAGKGIDRLISAFREVADANPGAWLVIAGEGGREALLRDLANRLRLERVVFAGFLPSPDGAYAAIDCLVAPSDEPDSFPRSVIEAMGWSRPVLGADTGGIPEAIVDGETGRILDPFDENAWSQAMRSLAGDPALALRWGRAGRARCAALFSAERQIGQVEALYEQMLEGSCV